MKSLETKYLREHLPTSPGIYLMKNAQHEVIYVGKAKNLKNRVLSYFQSKNSHTPKTKKLVSKIRDLEVMITNSEMEALLLERTLIRRYNPKYNILFRDDKTYPYIEIDKSTPWPRIRKQRSTTNKSSYYIGPYTSEYKLSQVLKAAHDIFPLVRCSEHEFKSARRPCNYYNMKKCLAPCVLDVDKTVYEGVIQDATAFIKGSDQELKKLLEEKMKLYSDKQEYEIAAMYRDQLFALKNLNQKQSVLFSNLKDADFIGHATQDNSIAITVLKVRERALIESFHFVAPLLIDFEEEVIEQFLLQYYSSKHPPEYIYTDFPIETWDDVAAAITELKQTDYKVIFKQALKGEKKKLLTSANENAQHQIFLDKENDQKNKIICEKIKEELALKNAPYKMECFDISNIGSEAMVGSKVSFLNGRPDKKNYRLYNLDIDGQNDFAAMHQVVKRRLERGVEEQDLPNLIVIDGGKPQMHALRDLIEMYRKHDIEFIGLAKSRTLGEAAGSMVHSKERILKLEWQTPKPLDTRSVSFRTLTSIRDEAHRFAITNHRKKRSKITVQSELDSIPSIGPVAKKRLLIAFGSIESIRESSIKELKEKAKLSERQAINIQTFLNKK